MHDAPTLYFMLRLLESLRTRKHWICCQHCHGFYAMCDVQHCPHRLQPDVLTGKFLVAYEGFCERTCRTSRTKGARADQFIDHDSNGGTNAE
jgi:hypothetical protein